MAVSPTTKKKLHPRSFHRDAYNYEDLCNAHPPLREYAKVNKHKVTSIDYADPIAVHHLNKALLLHHYELQYWEIPEGYLCPAVPGRAEYIHHLADLLGSFASNRYPKGAHISCLDIGIGANCVYPIIGRKTYKWSFIGSELDKKALQSAQQIIAKNTLLTDKVELRKQTDRAKILKNIIKEDEYIDVTICNPPFYTSVKAAAEANTRKNENLQKGKTLAKATIQAKNQPKRPAQNFRGTHSELWCKGGELAYISNMIRESKSKATNCFLFSSLVSKQAHLKNLQIELNQAGTSFSTTIELRHGNKRCTSSPGLSLQPSKRRSGSNLDGNGLWEYCAKLYNPCHFKRDNYCM